MQGNDSIVSSRPDAEIFILKKLSKINGLRHFGGLKVTQKSHIFQTLWIRINTDLQGVPDNQSNILQNQGHFLKEKSFESVLFVMVRFGQKWQPMQTEKW